MEVKQIATFVNAATLAALGKTADGTPVAVINEDLSNVVDVGTAVFDANKYTAYLEALINRIGRTIFVDRKYEGKAPKVLRDGWEYGSVMMKVSADLSEAQENPSWELVNGAEYSPNVFKKSKVEVKFYNQKTTLEIQISITRLQLKQSFESAMQLNQFLEMLYVWLENSMTVKMDELILRTINNMSAETVYADYQGAALSGASHAKAVNLLKLYNDEFGTALTTAQAMHTPDFLRFASIVLSRYIDRLQQMSRVFNVGNQARFTPRDKLHVVLHTDLLSAANGYLQSGTFHDEYTALPMHETVAYWQGTGGDFALANTGRVNVTTAQGHAVDIPCVVGVMFDHDALGVLNDEARTTNQWNAAAEFWNEWHKKESAYFNDFNEQFVVFFLA